MRKPDFIIGEPEDPYMLRWYIIPRNRWFNIYLHNILRDDEDEAFHDHPWWNLSIVLRGMYYEMTPTVAAKRRRGSLVLRRPTALHRLVIGAHPCWSLFITGPVLREWGFACPNGWRSFKEFTDYKNDSSSRGKGCA